MPINVNTSNNTVVIQPTNYTVTVTNNNAGSTTNVTNPYTAVINVASLGPQGTAGVQGDSIFSNLGGGVFATTSSIQVTGGEIVNNLVVGGSTIDTSSQVEVRSITKGFLPPRMTNKQREDISTPAVGLMVYCTNAPEGLYIYKSTGWTFIV